MLQLGLLSVSEVQDKHLQKNEILRFGEYVPLGNSGSSMCFLLKLDSLQLGRHVHMRGLHKAIPFLLAKRSLHFHGNSSFDHHHNRNHFALRS